MMTEPLDMRGITVDPDPIVVIRETTTETVVLLVPLSLWKQEGQRKEAIELARMRGCFVRAFGEEAVPVLTKLYNGEYAE